VNVDPALPRPEVTKASRPEIVKQEAYITEAPKAEMTKLKPSILGAWGSDISKPDMAAREMKQETEIEIGRKMSQFSRKKIGISGQDFQTKKQNDISIVENQVTPYPGKARPPSKPRSTLVSVLQAEMQR
jgi:hypothetical protein